MSKFYFYLTDEERSLMIESLISKNNTLVLEGKYTDGIDDRLLKILPSKKKKVKIITL